MRREIAMCVKKEQWWRSLPSERPDVSATLAEGLLAYAAEHADLEVQRRLLAEEKWKGVRSRMAMVLAELAKPGLPELHADTVLEIEIEGDEEAVDDNVDVDLEDEQAVEDGL